MADLRALLWYRSLEVKSIDDLYAAMKAAGVVKNEREFSVYADCAPNYYDDAPNRKKFSDDALVRIALQKAGHTELANLATEVLFCDLRSRPIRSEGNANG